MYQELYNAFFWPEMHQQCVKFVPNGNCTVCLTANRQTGRPAGHLHHITTGRPFESVSFDCVPMPLDAEGYCQVCVFVCATTRFPIFVALKDSTAGSMARAFLDYVLPLTGGAGCQFVSMDDGKANNSVLFTDFLHALRMTPLVAFAEHQQANTSEHTVKRAKEVLRRSLEGLPPTLC